jgi:septal ring factor EnvC (AmiA/AmiB activator)|tara:strand:+ start:4895 stop:5353 length:459 start_codon:yes stop_codon:yes gene_type:complete
MFGKLKVYLIMFGAFAMFAGVAYWYYLDTQKQLKGYAQNQAKLEIGIDLQRKQTVNLLADIQLMNTALVELNEDFVESRKQVRELEKTFTQKKNGEARDFGKLAEAKSGLVEKIINSGTVNVLRCFELLSGATPTEKENENENLQHCISNSN